MMELTELVLQQQRQPVQVQPQATAVAAPSVSLAKAHAPPMFTGRDARAVRPFVTKCQTSFDFHRMDDAHQRVLFAASHFSDQALSWYENLLCRDPSSIAFHDWPKFCEELQNTFGEPYPVFSAQGRLYRLRMQPNQRIVDFTAEFMIDAPVSKMDDYALALLYYEGLPVRIKNEVTRQGRPETIDPLTRLATRIDRTYWESRDSDRTKPQTTSTNTTASQSHPKDAPGNPTNAKGTRPPMSKERRAEITEERRRKGLCWFCGSDKHLKADCEEYKKRLASSSPAKGNAAQTTTAPPPPPPQPASPEPINVEASKNGKAT